MDIRVLEKMKENEISKLIDSISSTEEKIHLVRNIDNELVINIINNIEDVFSAHHKSQINIYEKEVYISFTISAEYDEVISHNSAILNYNGNWIKSRAYLNFEGGVSANIAIESRVPEEIKDILKACNKIQEVTTVETTVMC